MTLSISNIGENPQQPGITAEIFVPDQLIAGNLKLVTQPVQVGQLLPRGSVLGQQTNDSIDVTAGASNHGTGSVGSLTLGTTITYGIFVLTAKSATDFGVVDPEGNALPDATVGTPYSNAEIGFEITAGGTVFAAGDTFNVNVLEATGNYILSVKTASDGSQVPSAILATSTNNLTAAPATAGAYVMGEFNQNAINFDPSWSLPALQAALRPFGVFLKSSVSAADPING